MSHTPTHAHTVCKLHCLWLFRCPRGFSCPSVVTEWPLCPLQLAQSHVVPHTYRNTTPEALQKPATSLQKSSVSLVCLIDSIPAKQTSLAAVYSVTHLAFNTYVLLYNWCRIIRSKLFAKGKTNSKLWYSLSFPFHKCYLEQMDPSKPC